MFSNRQEGCAQLLILKFKEQWKLHGKKVQPQLPVSATVKVLGNKDNRREVVTTTEEEALAAEVVLEDKQETIS